jgi:WD40 repeat protein
VESGELRAELSRHAGPIFDVDSSPDGSLVATSSSDRSVTLWSTNTWRELSRLVGHSHWVNSVRFNATGSRLLTASGDGTVRVWRVPVRVSQHSAPTSQEGRGGTSPDERWTWEASDDRRSVIVMDPSTRKPAGVLGRHRSDVKLVAFDRTGDQAITYADFDQAIRYWQRRGDAWVEGKKIDGHSDKVSRARFSRDGSLLVSGGYDKTVRVWSRAGDGWREVITVDISPEFPRDVSLSPDGKFAAFSGDGNAVHVLDVADGAEINRHLFSGSVKWVAFSSDARSLLVTVEQEGDPQVLTVPCEACLPLEELLRFASTRLQ